MNTKAERMYRLFDRLSELGFTFEESQALRRIEMTLHRWAEQECGDSNDYCSWSIERDECDEATCTQCGHKWFDETAMTHPCPKCGDVAPLRRKATGKPYRCVYPHTGDSYRTAIADREKGALNRLQAIMAKHPDLVYYHQGDPRGCALYILRKSDLSGGLSIDSCYTRGLAVAA